MTGGSVNRSAGVLSRANELERLSGQQGALHEKLRAATERAAELQREMQKAEYELQVAQEQQRKAEDDVLTLQGRQDHYDVLTESLRLSCETMEQELAALERQTLENNKKAAGVQETIDKAESRAAALRQQAGSAAPMEILPAVWLTGLSSLAVVLLLDRLLRGKSRRPE